MKVYKVFSEGTRDMHACEIGPFESRDHAERTVTARVARGHTHISIEVINIDAADDDSGCVFISDRMAD